MTFKEASEKLEVRGLKVGDIVQHFKRELVKEPKGDQYLYNIEGFAKHTETGEILVTYRPLYDPEAIPCGRPIDMFLSEVDHEKYPDIKQKYRLEKYNVQEG